MECKLVVNVTKWLLYKRSREKTVFSCMRVKSNRISGESAHTSPTEALLIRYVSVNEHGSPVDSTRAIAYSFTWTSIAGRACCWHALGVVNPATMPEIRPSRDHVVYIGLCAPTIHSWLPKACWLEFWEKLPKTIEIIMAKLCHLKRPHSRWAWTKI